MSIPIDTYRPPRRPIEIAAELARGNYGEAAKTIRDLVVLARAYKLMLDAAGSEVLPAAAIEVVDRLEWMIR
jgi:hypothetical protein